MASSSSVFLLESGVFGTVERWGRAAMGRIEDREEVEERAPFTVVSHRGLLYGSAVSDRVAVAGQRLSCSASTESIDHVRYIINS
jgi:hypothetical protein